MTLRDLALAAAVVAATLAATVATLRLCDYRAEQREAADRVRAERAYTRAELAAHRGEE